jgi:chemotaxis protein CheZ
MAPAAPRAAASPRQRSGSARPLDPKAVVRELAAVADYIAHIKREIGALRANELSRDRIPTAHRELGGVVSATASATNTIITAAEEILGSDEASLDRYRECVESKLLEIFEACAFQDITGQRIGRVVASLAHLEKRLGRFADAVKVRDAASADADEARHQARREVLLLNGPAADGQGIAQADIDKLFR